MRLFDGLYVCVLHEPAVVIVSFYENHYSAFRSIVLVNMSVVSLGVDLEDSDVTLPSF
jgi:hypothetical protein